MKKADNKKIIMFFIKKLEKDFKKGIGELIEAEEFWRKLKTEYVPNTLLRDYGYTSVETDGEDTILLKGKRYTYYGYTITSEGKELMMVYEMNETAC